MTGTNRLKITSPTRSGSIWFLVTWTILALMLLLACGAKEETRAPGFTLTDAVGGQVSLYDLLDVYDRLTLVFYRGFF